MAELTSLQNIGKEMAQKLESIDIATAEALKEAGSRKAFIRLKLEGHNVCLVHLYALEGAVTDREFNDLPEDVKRELKELSDGLK